MQSVLAELDYWISGLETTKVLNEKIFLSVKVSNLLKINPILAFSEADIWQYLADQYNIPAHTLYSKDYRSLGCRLCSTPERSNDQSESDERWRGTSLQGGEYGIHSIKKAAA
ncbi:phosphoadenosine phosphosulfate reductase family protein [Coxiella endosymbiont of Ornithodoros amblus]|uniref:phosphoadenosine phosphosulfate reductase domain-containing protein n=1 Tax=Coxiella endosymbiont of Ornithodoros amblus TaxID=1656166 RepID=UPI00244E5589|nr:phosphoadenosine phosphosulfate reductase family protein [Coxiella endosymbiont of Ornithodoros amblus]